MATLFFCSLLYRQFESLKHLTGNTCSQLIVRISQHLRYLLSILKADLPVICFHTPLEARARYAYVRLKNPEEIRILELLPARGPNSGLCFRVHYADLNDQKVAYTAISYVWGVRNPAQDRLVECDGLRAYIPPTLHSALVDKNATQAEQDAAQVEKSLQVSMMDRIFSHAERVFINLGDDSNALPVLDKYSMISEDLWSSVNVAAGISIGKSIEILQDLGLPGASSTFWYSFRQFICRPWFTRVWVVQEYGLARSPTFMIGSHFRDQTFLTDAVARAAQHLEILYFRQRFYDGKTQLEGAVGENFFYVSEKYKAVAQICDARSPASHRRTFCELYDAATLFFEATDPRDKAYALLGLSADQSIKQDLAVNYLEDEGHLGLRISQYLSRRGFGIYTLYHCLGDVDHKYASWALSLTNTREGLANLIGPSGYTKWNVFNACGPARFVRKMSDLRGDGLTVRGWVIDTIQELMLQSMPHDAELQTPSDVEAHSIWQGHALDWMFRVSTLQPLPEDDFVRSCWRAVIADLAMPSGGEGRGFRRLREWAHADRCINTVDKVIRIAHKKWKGVLPPSYTEFLSDTELNDLHVHGESWAHALGRKLALSNETKSPCLIPHDARKEDKIVIIQGCQIPFIMRANEDEKGEYFRIVGCAYVHGIMDGEAIGDGSNCRDIEIR